MKLLTDKELAWSDIVANNSMNRKRKATGVNSYEKDLHFDLVKYLNMCLQQTGKASWLDCCCGEGNALLQYAQDVADSGLQDHVFLTGIDLVNYFQPIPPHINCLHFKTQSLSDWIPEDRYDLVTCVHGLHYTGDKLRIITQMLRALADDGILLANLDLKNIYLEGDPDHKAVKNLFRENQLTYNSRRKLLMCKGPRNIPLPYIYKGADDKAGPNYTGQPVVNSYYTNAL